MYYRDSVAKAAKSIIEINWEGGACEVLPLQKGEGANVLAMLKGGGTTSFWVVFYAVA